MPAKHLSLALVLMAGLLAAPSAVAQENNAQEQKQGQAQSVTVAQSQWTKRCEGPAGTAQERCFIAQQVVVQGRGPVLEAMAGMVGEEADKPVLLLTVPLGILLPPGVTLAVDKAEPKAFPVRVCRAGGCRVVVPLDDTMLGALKRGKGLRVAFADGANGRTIVIPVALTGFTAAWSSLSE